MNPDPTQPEPGDDATVAASSDLVDAIALEAVTAHAGSPPEERAAWASDDADPMVGRRLGAYRLRARLGGGGMGTVYLAERVEDYRQQVAIKLIKRGMDSEAIVRRFRTEIHVQAALGKHPNIAGLLDAGTAEDGRPYFVMEYVDGRRIDEYCDDRRLDVPARLRLFGQVCDAVQFAHQHAVIHRDLKPGNILVTADGVPKLIDFGIAKLIDPGDGGAVGIAGADAADGLTRTGELVLTPEYASPEQVTGEPATTASDVYSLGVVLYQLLTGRRPYRFKARTTAEIFQAICEQAPERPSTSAVRRPPRPRPVPAASPASSSEPRPPAPIPASAPAAAPVPEEIAAARATSPSGLKRVLAGDLDTIVLMAMRKEPERRYSSAEQLADDLRRYLDGRPVRARGDSTFYRVRQVRAAACGGGRRRGGYGAGAGGGGRRDHVGPGAGAPRARPRRGLVAPGASGSRSVLHPRRRGAAAQSARAAPAAQGAAPGRPAVLRGIPGGARRRPGAPRRAGGGPEPARPDHRGDRLTRRGRRPVPAGDRTLGGLASLAAGRPGVSGGAGRHPQRTGRRPHEAQGPSRRGPRRMPPRP